MQKPEAIERLVELYRTLSRYPFVLSANILKSDSNSAIKIRSGWSQRNLEKKEVTKFQKIHILGLDSGHISCPPVDISSEQLSRLSSSEKYSCILRECAPSKDTSGKKKQFLEIWQNNFLYKNFDVEEFDVHGSVYSDDEFGALEWSPDETKILYIAEKKQPKSQPFYKQKSSESKQKPEETVLLGEEYVYKPDWGEQLVDKHQPVIAVCDLKLENIQVLQGLPAHFSPGQVIWAKNGDGVYGIALENEPRRLGLIYCTNRKGYIFYLSLKGEFKILSEENKSVRSPRLSPDGKYLYWLQRGSGGPHGGCQELIKYDLAAKKMEVVVPIIKKPGDFSGIYSQALPRRCFSNDGKRLFFSTVNKTKITSYCVNLDSKEIRPIKVDGSASILDVYDDMVLISTSTFQSTPAIKLSKSIENLEWISVTTPEEILKGSVLKHMEFDLKNTKDGFTYFNAIYFGPAPPTDKRIPLVVYPHGGPHSSVADSYSIEAAFFASLGFGVLFVNYRGSTGAGEDSINFLPGKISDSDVKDNHHAVNEVLKEMPYINKDQIVLFGGSHGGFLVAHLSAQYPDTYKAVVSRNPVIDVFSMYCVTDIPDWDATESGFPFNESVPLTLEQANTMYKVSPICISDKIKAPTLLMIGRKDLRVPHSQGLYLYNTLRARNVKTRLNVYDDNHTLGQVPVHFDSIVNSALWFMESLGISS